jgi:hypothetical protein
MISVPTRETPPAASISSFDATGGLTSPNIDARSNISSELGDYKKVSKAIQNQTEEEKQAHEKGDVVGGSTSVNNVGAVKMRWFSGYAPP